MIHHCKSGGNNIEGNENLKLREEGEGAHLHLQMYLSDLNDIEEFLKFIDVYNLKGPFIRQKEVYNPCYYGDDYFNNR